MKTLETIAGAPRKKRVDLLIRLANFVSHPALAGYIPHGPVSLATGQSAAAQRGGSAVRIDGHTTEPAQPTSECYA